ncbi:hypothetical protein IscW_ISCW020005 [Ixodes scapularis]|uniref:Uncharacterized protein n=1 Tax=Ixodes scapularis TaxID=6945 RepID=B7PZ90_IXOSC|nr:hypothetical protein IscW_ISCW020005 [Ixodes scapularis]|eukprot:XP_002404969.1 hypothetical protein IscW_ISCW020005 [Ixodes scapularis]
MQTWQIHLLVVSAHAINNDESEATGKLAAGWRHGKPFKSTLRAKQFVYLRGSCFGSSTVKDAHCRRLQNVEINCRAPLTLTARATLSRLSRSYFYPSHKLSRPHGPLLTRTGPLGNKWQSQRRQDSRNIRCLNTDAPSISAAQQT